MSLPADLKREIATIERDITRVVYGSILQNSDEVLLRRGSAKGLKLYDEIEEDSHAYAVLQKRKLAVVARPWEVKAASERRLDKKAADLVKKQLESTFDRLTFELLDATLKGFTVSEIMWEDGGDEFFPKEFRARDQRRFTFTLNNDLRLLIPQNMVDGQAVPERKFIRHSFGSKIGNPFGHGLGSKLYFPVWFKRQGISFWLVFCEKFGMPTSVGKYPQNATETEQNKLLQALRDIAQDAGVIIPEGMEIALLEASRSSTSDLYERLVRYMDEQISEAVLGETLSTNIGSVGSKAAADTHNGVRLEVSKADADLLSQTINNTFCKWTTELNVPGAKPPTVWRIFEEQEDLDKRSNRDKTLFDMGFKLKTESVKEIYGDYYEPIEQGGGQRDGQMSDEDFLKNSGAGTSESPGEEQDGQQLDDPGQEPLSEFVEIEGISDEEFLSNSLFNEEASLLFDELRDAFKRDSKTLFTEVTEFADGDLEERVLGWVEGLEYVPFDLLELVKPMMSDLSVATFTLIGRRVVQLVADVDFAEGIRVTQPEDLLELKAIIETVYQDGISAIPEAYLNGDKFNGIFEDKISDQLIKRFNFTLSESAIDYKLINPDDVNNFSEVEFQSTNQKKKKNCTKGVSCGSGCISANKTCRKNTVDAATKAKVVGLKEKVKGGGSVAKSKKNTTKSAKSEVSNSGKLADFRKSIETQEGFDKMLLDAVNRKYPEGGAKPVPVSALRRASGLPKEEFERRVLDAVERGVVIGSYGSTSPRGMGVSIKDRNRLALQRARVVTRGAIEADGDKYLEDIRYLKLNPDYLPQKSAKATRNTSNNKQASIQGKPSDRPTSNSSVSQSRTERNTSKNRQSLTQRKSFDRPASMPAKSQNKEQVTKETFEKLGHRGLEAELNQGLYQKAEKGQFGKYSEDMKKATLQDANSRDYARGWVDRIPDIVRIANRDKVESNDINGFLDLATEQGMYKAGTPVGGMAAKAIKDVYDRSDPPLKKQMLSRVGEINIENLQKVNTYTEDHLKILRFFKNEYEKG